MGPVLLDEVAGTSAAVANSSARLAKVERLAACLRRLEPGEVHPAVAFLSGELRQRQIGVGWAALRDVPGPAADPTLTVREVDDAFERIGRLAGPGSQAERRRLVAELFARATAGEQRFLIGLLSGELRQGALEGVMAEAIARAAEVPAAEVRRALMLRGSLGRWPRPPWPKASPGSAPSTWRSAAPCSRCWPRPPPASRRPWRRPGEAAVEWKLDGHRIQVHRAGTEVAVFTRTLDDITARVPEVVAAALTLPVTAAVLDGEVIALQPGGRPHPFQVTAGRVGSRLDVERLARTVPLTAFLFDLLHLDGQDLIDRPGSERHAALAAAVPEPLRMPRQVTADPGRGRRLPGRHPGPRARGRDGQVARRHLGGRPPRGRLAQGQAGPHPGPGRAGRRVGPRPPPRLASATSTWAPATPAAAGS
jgi:DNA ligase-1